MKTIGTVKGQWFALPPCEWKRGCGRAATCTGLVARQKMGNVCSKHKSMGDRVYGK